MVEVLSHEFEDDDTLTVTLEFEGDEYELVFNHTELERFPNKHKSIIPEGGERQYVWLAERPQNRDLISHIVEVEVGLYLSEHDLHPLTKAPEDYEQGETVEFDIEEAVRSL